ncbi:MAG: triphosphoribosyl-dephospho-CoA synthase [Candidatus Bathyarchaeota archaeon]|nr:triphosphoribosyl-dephospho-CoA synthase [Candidatus Bathyarchaeota archaeon]MDW8041059.1 triphosphoribosyl-dephospho-CoA synthase [Nitrososphaerota archaeon]
MQSSFDKATHIAQCLELAILLEVSADKPGNVNLVVGFEDTDHVHFLASAVAASPLFRLAAERGLAVSRGEISLEEVGVGRIIRDCVAEIGSWQSGGNTLLGTVLLFVPLAVAAGMTPSEEGFFQLSELRLNLKRVVEATTPEDAVAVYEAIRIAKPSGLGKAPDLDVNDSTSTERILRERITLYKVFQIAAPYDMICSEWVNNYPVIFDFAYPRLTRWLKEDGNINSAVVHAFLEVLAAYPDTFIARKVGMQKAREVSAMAEEILKNGGLKTPAGREKLRLFDAFLRLDGNNLNPGTTADIIAAAIALAVLNGYRP